MSNLIYTDCHMVRSAAKKILVHFGDLEGITFWTGVDQEKFKMRRNLKHNTTLEVPAMTQKELGLVFVAGVL